MLGFCPPCWGREGGYSMYPPSKLTLKGCASMLGFCLKQKSKMLARRTLKAPQQGDSKNTRCKRGACLRSAKTKKRSELPPPTSSRGGKIKGRMAPTHGLLCFASPRSPEKGSRTAHREGPLSRGLILGLQEALGEDTPRSGRKTAPSLF
jgi:hypothetical protein